MRVILQKNILPKEVCIYSKRPCLENEVKNICPLKPIDLLPFAKFPWLYGKPGINSFSFFSTFELWCNVMLQFYIFLVALKNSSFKKQQWASFVSVAVVSLFRKFWDGTRSNRGHQMNPGATPWYFSSQFILTFVLSTFSKPIFVFSPLGKSWVAAPASCSVTSMRTSGASCWNLRSRLRPGFILKPTLCNITDYLKM